MESCYRELNSGPLPYQGSALPLSYNSNISGAEDGAQTRDPQLGRLVLYQLSYFRSISLIVHSSTHSTNFYHPWAGTDSNRRSRKATDLQSARFNHLPTYPALFSSFLSLLSDSNQRPRDYKSRALAN